MTGVYRGLGRRERRGWIFGLTGGQAVVVGALAAPPVWLLSAQQWRLALLAAGGFVLGCVLVVVPVRGRPALRWLAHWVLYQVGVATGWSRWQSRAAAGAVRDAQEPDLPGVLTRLTFPDGPPYRAGGRVCLIHDTVEGRWGVTARLVHGGVGLTTPDVQDLLARRLGTLLHALGSHGILSRVSVYVRSVPDDGTDYAVYRQRHQFADAPPLALQASDELDRIVGDVAVRHEVFVTVSGSENTLRRPAVHAGGGVAGRAEVLYRALDGLEDPLRGLGASSVRWLDGAGMATAIRTAFNPGAAGHLAWENLHDGDGLPWAAAAATQAPSPQARVYRHDGFDTAAYTVLIPSAGSGFGSLAPILAVRSAGERRCLAIHYEILPPEEAAKDVRSQRFAASLLRDVKNSRGFARTAVDDQRAVTASSQEQAIAAGHSLVRYALAASVTVPVAANIEDHAARMENDAASRLRLLRLELAQDAAFIAACVPVGIGLPRSRGRLL